MLGPLLAAVSTSQCWEAHYSIPSANSPTLFRPNAD